MRVKILRKLLVILIMVIPVFANTDCKKQAKCGCDGDALFSLEKRQAKVYFTNGESISFQTLDDPYSTYIFCNPGEMFPNMSDSKTGDVLLVSGQVFWECNYLYQSSNYSYQSVSRVYQVQVTEVYADLYGK